ncbi:MAG: glycosyltransferase family 2 protein [Vicinamibacterales bacterium]|jgi:hypothetical protein|nr:glycosyl transferase [Acidobacteriota bacterium]MDP7295617.1 glycosyltransferase family 2 protein [Vicinamibacterales bacterium]MDP7472190.1 glycosyltransferase family 2 protein [Vicinamibacterales bacterium]MDP7672519.1 glycosyltransferase family 2 protein [Vicinamibacterales bacterium]HJO37142.1 glycosyltransferase family 2 protein [Vicinamibacterales bacterium]|tara:strand:- start:2482 stop:3330 length:849 start_codon:yes stop_codon:yes gene_type:complete
MSAPAVAIVIVSFNAREDLLRCLCSLHAHPPSRPHEIVVVDNASSDGSVESVRRDWPAARVVALTANVGFARGCNLGFADTDAPLVLLLNSDVVVREGALDHLIEALLSDETCAAAGPRLVDAAGIIELSWGRMIGPFTELRQKSLQLLRRLGIPPVAALIARRTRQVRFPDWVSGACLLVRRADAEHVGLLDERFFMYLEDVDFCAALRARGRRILFTPAAEVQHARGRSASAAPDATARAYRQSQLAFYAKHHPGWLPILRVYLRLRRQLPSPPARAVPF